jgi:hypothetical protein
VAAVLPLAAAADAAVGAMTSRRACDTTQAMSYAFHII